MQTDVSSKWNQLFSH